MTVVWDYNNIIISIADTDWELFEEHIHELNKEYIDNGTTTKFSWKDTKKVEYTFVI